MPGWWAIELVCGTAYVSSWMIRHQGAAFGIEFNLPISGGLRLFWKIGFEVLDDLEWQAPQDSPDRFGTPGRALAR